MEDKKRYIFSFVWDREMWRVIEEKKDIGSVVRFIMSHDPNP